MGHVWTLILDKTWVRRWKALTQFDVMHSYKCEYINYKISYRDSK